MMMTGRPVSDILGAEPLSRETKAGSIPWALDMTQRDESQFARLRDLTDRMSMVAERLAGSAGDQQLAPVPDFGGYVAQRFMTLHEARNHLLDRAEQALRVFEEFA